MDRWLIGLARLSTASPTHRLLIGIGIALAGLAIRAAASPLYGEVTGFTILLPAATLAALAAGWTGALAALFGLHRRRLGDRRADGHRP